MSYTPNNINVYIAAYSGAVAGMGASNRFPRDSVAGDYVNLTKTAGAYAQQFDTLWGANNATTLDVDNITQLTAAAWESRAPQSTNPADFALLCGALIAMVTQSETYFAGQGIPPYVPAPAAAGGTLVFKPGATGATAPVFNDWSKLVQLAKTLPGCTTVQVDTSAQGFAPAVIPAGTWSFPGGLTFTAQNEDAVSFADGAHLDPAMTLVRLMGAVTVSADGTTPVWTPAQAFNLILVTEGSGLNGTTAPFFHANQGVSTLSLQLNEDAFLGNGANAVITVDAGSKIDILSHSGTTIGANAIAGLGTADNHTSSDVITGVQTVTTFNTTLASVSALESYTPAIAGNWSPTPTQVAAALDQLAAKVGSLFPTFGLTMYTSSIYENTITGANVTQVEDQSTALHLLTATGTTGPTQTASGIGTNTTWHFDHTANGGAGNKLVSEGPAGSNTPPTEFYLGDSDWTIACIFKSNGASHNYAANATCPTLFGTSSGSNPPLGAGLVCGLNPGDATKIQVSGYVTDLAGVMHQNPAQAPVANGHYVIAELTGGTLSTYLDSLPAVTTASGPIGDHTNQVQIGRNQASTLSNYDGEILIMLTWNRGLTSSERTQVQNAFRALSGLP